MDGYQYYLGFDCSAPEQSKRDFLTWASAAIEHIKPREIRAHKIILSVPFINFLLFVLKIPGNVSDPPEGWVDPLPLFLTV